jgi:hypothetical protein
VQPLERPPYALIDSSTDRDLRDVFTLGGLETEAGEVLSPDGVAIPALRRGPHSRALLRSGYPAAASSLADASFSDVAPDAQPASRAPNEPRPSDLPIAPSPRASRRAGAAARAVEILSAAVDAE